MISTVGPLQDPEAAGKYGAWDHEEGEWLKDRDGSQFFQTREDAHDLQMEYQG